MDELTSLAVRAVAILQVLLAVLGFVKRGHVTLDHNLLLPVGKRALVSVFALAVELEVLAHLSAELVHVWCGRSEIVLPLTK